MFVDWWRCILNIQGNSYELAVILSPFMYIYDFSQLLTYIIVVLEFVLTKFSDVSKDEGVATEDEMSTPISGTITLVSDSNHAIGLETEDSLEIIVHLGIDTVDVKEKVFEVFLEHGQRIKQGEKIATMNHSKVSH